MVLLSNVSFYFSPNLIESGDDALNSIKVENAKHFTEYLGPYSRFGFFHPGPISFYYLAFAEPFLRFVPTLFGRYLVAQLLLNSLWLCVVANVGRRIWGKPYLWFLLWFLIPLQMVFLAGGSPILLSSIWGPTVVIIPVAVFVLCASQIFWGDLTLLPVAALAAVFAVHNHLATVVVVVPLSIFVTVSWIYKLKSKGYLSGFIPRGRGKTVLLSLTFAVIVITSFPPVYEEISGSAGNISRIISFLASEDRNPHAWKEVAVKLSRSLTDPWVVLTKGHFAATTRLRLATGLVLLLLAASVQQFRKGKKNLKSFIVLTWLSLALSAFGARFVMDELYPYLFHFVYGLVGFLCFFGIKELWEFWESHWHWWPRFLRSPVLGVILLGCVVLVWVRSHAIEPPPRVDHFERMTTTFSLPRDEAVFIYWGNREEEHRLWVEVSSLAMQFIRDGYRVCVPDGRIYLFGEKFRCRHDTHRISLIFTRRHPNAGVSNYLAFDDYGVFVVESMNTSPADFLANSSFVPSD